MKKKNKIITLFRLFVFLFVSIIFINLISFVFGYGISSSYYSGKPLIMAPGETREIVFGELQNMVGNRDITIRVELLKGMEIATITDSNLDYLVPLGRKDVPINMKISVPKNVSEGEKYLITIRYYEVNAPITEEGTVGLSMASQTSMKVLVVKKLEEKLKTKKEGIGVWWILLLIIMVVIVIVAYLIRSVIHKNI